MPIVPPSGGSVLPSSVLAGYVETWGFSNGSTNDLDAQPSAYNLLYHSFAPIAADGSVSISSNPMPIGSLAAKIAARSAAGKPTILSIGGSGGSQNGLGTPAARTAFLNSIRPIIETYGFAGIDWDLEFNVPGGISAPGLAEVSRALRKAYGENFLITMAPFAGVDAVYRRLAADLHSTGDLAYVGWQFYNDSEAVTTAQVIAQLRSWMADTGITPAQFVIGFWRGPDDWRRHVISYATMASIYRDVKAQYPTIRGTYTWGLRYTEHPNQHGFANAMRPVVQPTLGRAAGTNVTATEWSWLRPG